MGADAACAAARPTGRLGRHARERVRLASPEERSSLVLIGIAIALTAIAAAWLWSEHRRVADVGLLRATDQLDLVANLVAHETRQIAGSEVPSRTHLEQLVSSLPPLVLSSARRIYLADPDGFIVASTLPAGRLPHGLHALFQPRDRGRTTGEGGVVHGLLHDGTPVLAAIRNVGSAHVAVIQPRDATAPGPAPSFSFLPFTVLALACGLAGFGLAGRRTYDGSGRTLDGTPLTSALDTSAETGRCGVWDWDVARGRVFLSAAIYDLLGYRPRDRDLSIDEMDAIFHPQHVPFRELAQALAASADGTFERDVQARAKDGTWRWLRLRAESVRDPFDGAVHLVGLATDVTRERGETERRDFENARLREAVEAISEAFVLWDADGRLVLCNSKFLALHGIAAGSADAIAAEALSRVPVTGSVAADATLPRSSQVRSGDGRWFHVNERRTRDGGIVAVGTDISHLKRKEAKLRAREERLQCSVREAETVAQRFAALAERNHEANLAKTEFLARMSHELRTPLNHIIGFADMMQQEVLGPHACPRYREYSRDIHRSGNELLDQIERILHLARLESGEVVLSPVLTCAETLLHSAAADIMDAALARNVTLDLGEGHLAATMLQADETALREILVQVLGNAVKFNRSGGVVRVRIRRAGASVNVFVSDDGVGIPDHVLPLLGRPFEQVEGEYVRASRGSGSGLPIASALARLHGGHLRIRSQFGLGTVVLLHLPATQPAANDAEPEMLDWSSTPRLFAAE